VGNRKVAREGVPARGLPIPMARVPLVHVLVHVPVRDVPLANLVSTLDHPCQHRHDSHEKLLALAHGLAVENTAPVENVQNCPAFPG
jgi:hypothetical protein